MHKVPGTGYFLRSFNEKHATFRVRRFMAPRILKTGFILGNYDEAISSFHTALTLKKDSKMNSAMVNKAMDYVANHTSSSWLDDFPQVTASNK